LNMDFDKAMCLTLPDRVALLLLTDGRQHKLMDGDLIYVRTKIVYSLQWTLDSKMIS
jgi:hypothetical protein